MPPSQPRTFSLFLPTLKDLLARQDLKELRRTLQLIGPLDLAQGWDSIEAKNRLLVFKLLTRRKAVLVFETLDITLQAQLFELLEKDRAAPAADTDSAQRGPEQVRLLIRSLSTRTIRQLSRFLSKEGARTPFPIREYPAGTVGHLMRPAPAPLDASLTARQALERAQAGLRPGADIPTATLFVAGKDGRLQSAVEMDDLLAAPPDIRLSELAASVELIKLPPTADQEEAVRLFDRYVLSAAPVVDEAGIMLGVVISDDIVQVTQTEASEDIAKLAGTSPEELGARSVFAIVGLRMPWLLVTVAGGALVSLVIREFEDILRQLLALASFIPLIAAMGGSVGTQSSTIVVRGLATGEIPEGALFPVVWREMRAGSVLGAAYGTLAGLAAFIVYGRTVPPSLGIIVGVAIMISMTATSALGALFPFVLKRLNADPANATGPFITSTTDLLTTILYLTVASAFVL